MNAEELKNYLTRHCYAHGAGTGIVFCSECPKYRDYDGRISCPIVKK